MKNILLLQVFLIFSFSNAQKCKFEKDATDDATGKSILITKPKVITPSSIGSTEYIFAKGGKIGNENFLLLDIRADKKFTINSECKIAFNAESGAIEINFKEYKIAYFNDIGDHSSYWKLKTRIPIDSTFINTISSNKVISIKWDTTEDTFEKTLKGKHYKNLTKVLECLKPSEDKTENEAETDTKLKNLTETKPETIIKAKPEIKTNTKSETKKEVIKSEKEKEIEKTIVIPDEEKEGNGNKK